MACLSFFCEKESLRFCKNAKKESTLLPIASSNKIQDHQKYLPANDVTRVVSVCVHAELGTRVSPSYLFALAPPGHTFSDQTIGALTLRAVGSAERH